MALGQWDIGTMFSPKARMYVPVELNNHKLLINSELRFLNSPTYAKTSVQLLQKGRVILGNLRINSNDKIAGTIPSPPYMYV
jgi:hypothetical protein